MMILCEKCYTNIKMKSFIHWRVEESSLEEVMLVMNLEKTKKGIQNSRDIICKQERPKRAVWLGNPELGMIVLKSVGQEWQEKKLERS